MQVRFGLSSHFMPCAAWPCASLNLNVRNFVSILSNIFMNIKPTLQLTKHFREGAFGRVEFNHQTNRALKLFFAKDTSQFEFKDRQWENDIRKMVFNDEVCAYEIANSCPDLLPYVPNFFCKRSFSSITSESGQDVSHLYLLDCCYEIEFINGTFKKLSNLTLHGTPEQEVAQITALFKAAGINHTIDADATTSDDLQKIEKIIDFSMRDTYFCEENLRI